jgi:hypothetical protein
MNLTKEVKDFYPENYKTLEQEIKDDKHHQCSCLSRVNIINMSTLLKTICRFNAIPIKIPMLFTPEL